MRTIRPVASAPRSLHFWRKNASTSLDGPIVRIAAPDTPVPFSTPLEEFFLPKTADIVTAARTLAAY